MRFERQLQLRAPDTMFRQRETTGAIPKLHFPATAALQLLNLVDFQRNEIFF